MAELAERAESGGPESGGPESGGQESGGPASGVRGSEGSRRSEGAVTVLIVDDQAPFRVAARSVVSLTPGFSVVGEARSGEEAVEQVGSLHPQLVLMDINMDGISGIEATRRITAAHPDVRVVLLSTYQAEDLPADAGTCGASAYVHKEMFGPDELEDVWAAAPGTGLSK